MNQALQKRDCDKIEAIRLSKEKIMFRKLQINAQKWMRGRYGIFDSLNKTLIIISLISLFVANFVGILGWPLRLIAYALFLFTYYRLFSKKNYVRSNENQKYIWLKLNFQKKFKQQKTKFEQRKEYKYFRCNNYSCKQQLRAPKGRGEIKVTCSKCQQVFIKKV